MEGIASLNLLRQAHHIDQDVTLAINALHCPATDAVWQVFSNKEIWFVLYAAVLVFLYIRLGWKRATSSQSAAARFMFASVSTGVR